MSGLVGAVGARSGLIGGKDIPDGYEEGTWTVTHGYMTATNNHTAQYTKIGNMVHVYADVTVTGAADSSQTGGILTGFPFTAMTGINKQAPFIFKQGGGWWWSYELEGNGSTYYIYQSSGVIVTRSNMNNSRLLLSGTYLTN